MRVEADNFPKLFGGGIRLAWGSVRNQVVGNVIRNTGRGGIFAAQSAELVIRNNRVTGSGGGGPGLGIEIDESVIERYPWIPGPWSYFKIDSPPEMLAVTSDHSVQWDGKDGR